MIKKIINEEEYKTTGERIIAFEKMCNSKSTCADCKYYQGMQCEKSTAAFRWLKDKVELKTFNVTRSYFKTVSIKAYTKKEALEIAERSFDEASLEPMDVEDEIVEEY